MASVGSAWWFWAQRGILYETALGEHRTVVLDDGSRVDLNTATHLTVHLSRDRRAVALETGEVLFEVAPDPARPFVVTAGALRIRDIGTRFDVDRRPERVTVAVLEGRVQIDAELERYHPIRIVFADPRLRGVPLSGTFDSADLDPFLRALERILRVRAKHPDPTTIVLEKMRN